MVRKLTAVGAAAVLALAVAFVAAGDSSAVACKGKAARAAMSGSCCEKGAKSAAAKSSCSKGAAAAMKASCSKGAAAAMKASCSKGAAAAMKASCSKGAKSAAAKACCSKGAKSAAMKKACCERRDRTAALKGIVDDLAAREGTRVELTGEMACGRCTFHVTDTCAPLLRTSDGKVYPLLHTARVDRMHEMHADSYRVTARVRKADGLAWLDVVSFSAM